MKKVVLLAAAVAMVSLASCKKKGVCTCDYSGTEVITSYEDMTGWEKKAAKADCNSEMTYTITVDGEDATPDADPDAPTCEWSKK